MKKLLLTVATITVTISASAQFYVGINAGYGIGGPKQVLGTITNSSASGTSTENIYGSLGGGLNLGLTPGFWFGEHVGAELGLNYFMGSKVEVTKVTSPFGELTANAHSSQFRLMPSLVIRSSGEKLNIYAKAGLVIPAVGQTVQEIENTGYQGPNTASSSRSETVGQMTLGYTGAIGFNLGLGERLGFFAEVSAVSLRVSANKTTVTDYSSNGTDVMANLSTYNKEINYVDKLDNNSNTGPTANQDQAEDRLRINSNYGGIFLNVGLKFQL